MANNPQNQLATKRDLKGFQNNVKNYMGLLHERLSNQAKVVAEQYTGIDKRLAKVESKTDMLIETVAEIKTDTTVIREELGNKADRVEVKKLEHRVAVLESRT